MSILSNSELHKLVQQVVESTLGDKVVQESKPAASITTPAGDVSASARVIAIGADHGGYNMKEMLKVYLSEQGHEVIDCGTDSVDSVDYPDIAYGVASKVSAKEVCCGIIIDGAGIGSCMTANKVPGVRAAMCYDYATAVNSREHNHANVLTLGAGLIGPNLAKQITDAFLSTKFGEGRHARRVEMIMKIESRQQVHND